MADRPARVLVVDDDPFVRDILRRFLRDKGFEVESAVDGERALKAVRTYEPDIVLLDIRMPVMDGVACLERLARDEPDCGVIMISGEADTELAKQTLSMGAADFIYKPFDLEYLETSLLAKLMTMGRT